MRDTIFLYIIAILAFGFGFINFIQYLLKRNQTAQVVGTIISIKTPNPQNSKQPDRMVGLFFGCAPLRGAYFILRDGCNGCDG